MTREHIHFVFDMYGTLIDTACIHKHVHDLGLPNSVAFTSRWRSKQLEYAFRRALMQNHVTFETCTAQALEYTLQALGMSLTETQTHDLLDHYNHLPPYPEAHSALSKLNLPDYRLHVFTNGSDQSAEILLQNAKLRHFFHTVVSTAPTRTFKPAPAAYAYLLEQTRSTAENTFLISSNPFDIHGAKSADLKTLFIQRDDTVLLDPWPDLQPCVTITSLSEIHDIFAVAEQK